MCKFRTRAYNEKNVLRASAPFMSSPRRPMPKSLRRLVALSTGGLVAWSGAARAQATRTGLEWGEIGEDLSDAGDFAGAAAAWEHALEDAEATDDDARQTHLLGELAGAYYSAHEYARGYERKRAQVDHLLESGPPAKAAAAALEAATLAVLCNQFRDAERHLAYAEAVFTEVGDRRSLAAVHQHRAVAAERRRAFDKAIQEFLAAREEALGGGDARGAAERLLDIGNICKERLNRYDDAIGYFDRAIAELAAAGAREAVLAARIDKGLALVERGDVDAATALLAETRTAILRGTDVVASVRVTQALANARYRAGDWHGARTLVGTIAPLLPLVPSPDRRTTLELDAWNLTAMLDAELGRKDAAFKLFERALATARERRLPAKESLVRNNLGYWLRETGDPTGAVKQHATALALDRATGGDDAVAFDLRNLGLAKFESGDLEGAAADLTEALGLARRLHTAYNAAYAELGLGHVALRRADFPAAMARYQGAIDVAEAHKLGGFLWLAYAGAAAAADAQGDAALAAKFFKRATDAVEAIARALEGAEARRDLVGSAKVSQLFRAYDAFLRRNGRARDAESLRQRLAGLAPSI
jgi:tetratricopeptide (TPR) repeat protein